MRITLIMLAILITASLSISVQGCTNVENGQITGGACLIKDLQNSREDNLLKDKEFKVFLYQEMDFIPFEQSNKLFPDNCLFGKCLYKQVLEKTLN